MLFLLYRLWYFSDTRWLRKPYNVNDKLRHKNKYKLQIENDKHEKRSECLVRFTYMYMDLDSWYQKSKKKTTTTTSRCYIHKL